MQTAVRPDYFNVPSLQRNEKAEKATPEELALHEMAQMRGWQILKDTAEQASRELGEVNKQAIAQGLPLEEIGRNTVVIALAQGVIERLLNKVADATEACLRDE